MVLVVALVAEEQVAEEQVAEVLVVLALQDAHRVCITKGHQSADTHSKTTRQLFQIEWVQVIV